MLPTEILADLWAAVERLERASAPWVEIEEAYQAFYDAESLLPEPAAELSRDGSIDEALGASQHPTFDGILGNLPEWVPDAEAAAFFRDRFFLLAKFGEAQTRGFVAAMRRGGMGLTAPPAAAVAPLETVIRVGDAALAGEEQGLQALLGATLARVLKDGRKVDERRRLGGQSSAKTRRKQVASDYEEIRRRATRLLEAGKNPRDVVSMIVSRKTFKEWKIREALRTHPSGHWVSKERFR